LYGTRIIWNSKSSTTHHSKVLNPRFHSKNLIVQYVMLHFWCRSGITFYCVLCAIYFLIMINFLFNYKIQWWSFFQSLSRSMDKVVVAPLFWLFISYKFNFHTMMVPSPISSEEFKIPNQNNNKLWTKGPKYSIV